LIQKSQILTISIVQPDLVWESAQANFDLLEESINSISSADLIVLPEMFSSGFSMQPQQLYETIDGRGVKWMQRLARQKHSVITGSLIIKDKGKYYNRLLWVTPEGNLEFYDKRHLFSFAEEDVHYSAGSSRMIVELKGWRICPLICYDLRFPVWSRNQDISGKNIDSEYDVLVYVANWPEARSSAWNTLLAARAHENQAYVVGVNRVGRDGNQINYAGESCIISPKGESMVSIEKHQPGVQTLDISLKELQDFRAKFGAWRDKDQFQIK